jgi:hypothetical protein
MLTDTEIANLAATHLGQSEEINDLETEDSAIAAAFRTVWDVAYMKMLRDFDFPESTETRELELIEEDPTPEWGYSYAYPAGCVFFRRILSGSKQDTEDTRVPFRVMYIDGRRVICTDVEEPVGEWTHFEEGDTSRANVDFDLALSYLLASLAGRRICGGDPNGAVKEARELYLYQLSCARANSKQERGKEVESDAAIIRARD